MSTTIIDTVRNCVADGLQHLSAISLASGHTPQQVYSAIQYMAKRGEIIRILPGFDGAVVLPGDTLRYPETTEHTKPNIPESPNIPQGSNTQQTPEEPFSTSFDFNSHFDKFIEETTEILAEEIQKRLQKEVLVFTDTLSNKIKANLQVSAETILNKLNQQITEVTKDIALNSFSKESTGTEVVQQPPTPPTENKPKVRLPKVCVAGVLPVHFGNLVTEFSNTFDLSYWNDRTGNSDRQLQDYSQNCEVVFWHTSHCSHSAEAIVKKYSKKIVKVSGGLSNMRVALTNYYKQSITQS